MSRAANRTVLSVILTQIVQSTRDSELITMCILALQYESRNETRHYHLEDHLLKQVIAQAQFQARERDEMNVVEALPKASLALAK